MAISMHSASAPIFVHMLGNMLGWLDKAEAHARARNFDADNYLGLRLAPDMLPFSRQIQIACDACNRCVSKLAGLDAPTWENDEATLDALRTRIEKTIDYARSIPAQKIDGSEEREITLAIPNGELKFEGEAFLKHFSLPNFFFHCTMTYALLRQGGIDLGKIDYLGAL